MDIDGVLLVDKPKGFTSHDIVDFVRKKFKIKKVGHCGTLDPMATGLLVLVLGKATKIQDLLMSEDKRYEGVLRLGQSTLTQDSDGQIVEEKPVPPLSLEEIKKVFDRYVGDFYQVPPMISAIKSHGVPLYKLAREGKEIERKPRLVHVYSYEIKKWDSPFIHFEVLCGKGFYVRTYCHDIGQDLGCGGHLFSLVRLQSGNFKLNQALSFDFLNSLKSPEELLNHVLTLPQVSRIRRQ
ncbi:tRNA pseudouridine(55) synthase TruB [Candidatus Methylacidiphilum infernorum]|uniref:tRNA pseudouridine synthase B n=1 Tax=Candidatus Methylacidiphilum infernorum TaxID=511746 RepID=A0ABX7PY06_9BACT|nr:tRNA pseudouridine(55) synthase TruB [Candidatus Methylacidiphilum infernorum]QSR87548.1 tRNA pseudouridine(55) synthase TruB [Candidatus Methylacidiphilum infernorum]